MLRLIRELTSTPVPKLYSWDLADDNPLDLEPFILMESIEGTSLNHLHKDSNAIDSRPVREDIIYIDFLFKQISRFQLQLFELDFDRIGSLPMPKISFSAPPNMNLDLEGT